MYMTRFPINMTLRQTRSMLASPYRLHAAIAGSFPPANEVNGHGRVLWRIDDAPQGGKNLFIVSPTAPDLRGLNEQIGWEDRQWQTVNYDQFLASLQEGQRYRFRLKANPVVSRSSVKDGSGRSKRLSHLTSLQQEAWLVGEEAFHNAGCEVPELFPNKVNSRADLAGFTVVKDGETGMLRLRVSHMNKVRFKAGATGRQITLSTAVYDGVLAVTDKDRLCHALISGIGKAKGFGCGLLTLSGSEQNG